MPIKFYCKKCDQRLSIASKKAGKTVSCPACHTKITIPTESEARRPDTTKNTSETRSQSKKPSQPEENFNPEDYELLNDLENLSALGDSWDEILIDDVNEAVNSAEEVPPAEEEPTPEEIASEEITSDAIASEKPEDPNQTPPVIETQSETDSVTTEPDPSPVTEIASPETKAELQEQPSPPRASNITYVEEDDEDEDDDDDFSFRSAESEFEEMDLTPMVDVTFLLLIFFMITASFSLQKSIQVPPPNPDEDGVSQSLQTLDDFREESIIVEIDNNNGIYVDDTKLSNPDEIVQAILDRRNQDGKAKSELVLSAHKAARHETVVAVVDAANEVGMQKIRLASYRGPED